MSEELTLFKEALNRRRFMRAMAITGVGVGVASVVAGCGGATQLDAATVPETDVLNFALNLEYLEANFYLVATTGSGLTSADTGGGPAATGGNKVTFADPQLAQIAAEITFDEVQHVKFLRSALGASAVAQPAINLAALGIGYANDSEFLTLARAFEDTGVSAYNGAATLLTGNNLQAAASILATEALHTGNVRLKVIQKGLTVPALDSQDKPPTTSQYFAVDSNALAIKRTTSQVLSILYASTVAGTSKGGFFPNGLNGNIKTI